jgi:hypothetical protein
MSNIEKVWELYSNGNIDENQFMQEFDIFKANLASEGTDKNSLSKACSLFSKIVEAKPKLASEVFEEFKRLSQNIQNMDGNYLFDGIKALKSIIIASKVVSVLALKL